MTFKLSTTARNAAVDGVVDLIDAGAVVGLMGIFTGTQPANPQTAFTGTLLSTIYFSDPAFSAAGATNPGQAEAGAGAGGPAITSDTAIEATGTAGWARVYNGDAIDPDDAVFDVDIGQGSGTLSFDSTTFQEFGTCTITSMIITIPEG
jgi:hypothetical protein